MSEFEWSEARAQEIIATHKNIEGATLLTLQALQAEFGFVPTETLPMVAEALNLSRAEVHGVFTFYHELRAKPHGRHVLKLCRAEACQSVNGDALADFAKQRLGIDWHETTPDNSVTLEPVFCLGLCGTGPSGMVDGEVVGRLNKARIEEVIAGLRK